MTSFENRNNCYVNFNGRILRHRAPAKCSNLDRFLHDSELKYVFIVRNGTISKILYSAPRNGYYTLNNCKIKLLLYFLVKALKFFFLNAPSWTFPTIFNNHVENLLENHFKRTKV